MGFGGGGSAGAAIITFTPSTAEQGSAVVVDDAQSTGASGTTRYYGQAFILPATSKFWLITGIEWKNGITLGSNILCGLDKIGINTIPPTATDIELAAYTSDVAQAGASSIQRNSVITQTKVLGSGEIVIPWFSPSVAAGTFRYFTVGAENDSRAITDSRTFPTWKSVTAWTASVARIYMKVYFVGYG